MDSKVSSTGIWYSNLPESFVKPESKRPRLSEVADCENVQVNYLGCEDRTQVIQQVINHGVLVESMSRMASLRIHSREDREEERLMGVSTELKLYECSWKITKRLKEREVIQQMINHGVSMKSTSRMASLRIHSREDREEERRMGVSTELKLYECPWTIIKRLMESDIGDLSRLLLGTNLVQKYMIPWLNAEQARDVEDNVGARITVWDYNTESEHQLTLKRWRSNGSYVLINKWKQKFVNRRELKKGDEIGFYWDGSRFCFSVLKRAKEERSYI